MRNFRSLDTAAKRVETLLDTMRLVSKNYSLGVDPALLKDLNDDECYSRELRELANDLHAFIEEYQRESKIDLKLKSIRKRKLKCEPSHIARYYALPKEQCRNANWFRAGRLVSHDCRPLRERHIKLYEALKSLRHGTNLIDFLDHFGIEVSMSISDALDGPTRHLSMFFDSYYIANSNGQVHFARNNTAWSDHYEYQRTSIPFASFADIAHLLLEQSDEPIGTEGIFTEDESSQKAGAVRVGHSAVRIVKVDDVALSVFIHPLTIDISSTAVSPKSGARGPEGPAKASYIVGVVRQRALADEAIRLRLGPAVDATLTIAMLLALLPILRFWATGDRSISGRFSLYGIGASAVAATALGTALLWGFITKHIDGQILDQRLVEIGDDVRRNFNRDLRRAIKTLEADVDVMRTKSAPPPATAAPAPAGEDSAPAPATEHSTCPPKQPIESDSLGREHLRQHLLCPSVLDKNTDCPSILDENTDHLSHSRSARLLTTFLIDEDGVMDVCSRYRKRLSQKLNLSFRNYFNTPQVSEATAATREKRCWERGAPFLSQIDSVVQGTKEIVISFAVRGKEDQSDTRSCPLTKTRQEQVAVAIARLQSIDDVILPPHFEYAIVDQSGRTVFHSDEDRVRVSNFIDDTGNDPAIRAAIESGNVGVLGATYDGTPIRAHIGLLYESYDTEWTLVVFRSHGLVDRVSALAMSLALLWWIVISLLVTSLVILAAYVRRLLGFSTVRPSTALSLVHYRVTIVVLVFAILGLIHIYDDIDDVTTTVGLPFLIVGIVLVSTWFGVGAETNKEECSKRAKIGAALIALAALVFSVAVVPMLGWQGYFRAQLSRGLAEYLQEESLNAMKEKKADFHDYRGQLRKERKDHDSMYSFLEGSMAGYGEQERQRLTDLLNARDDCQRKKQQGEATCDPPSASEGATRSEWFFGNLWPLVGYSSFSQAIMWYSSETDRGFDDVDSPTGALFEVIGRIGAADAEAPPHPSSATTSVPANGGDVGDMYIETRKSFIWLAIVAYVLLLLFICYSVARTKFGHAGRIALLPRWCPNELAKRMKPVRILLVKQSERALKGLIRELKGKWGVEVETWDDVTSAWTSDDRGERGSVRSKRRTIYVVEDLRGATEGNRAEELASELRAIPPNVSIILCSDIVPTYHMRPGTLDEPDNILLPGAIDWPEIVREFEVGVLCSVNADSGNKKSSNLNADVMETEARANEDLKHIAHEVAGQMKEKENKEDWYSNPQLRDKALRQFRAMAQPKFKAQWEASSFDERLQLIALARGGSTNIRQPAAISSLANRGLITTTDPLQLRSEAFRQFIKDDLAHDTLDDWRRQGHHDWWRVTWLPLVVLAVLGLLFFLSSNPEAVGTLAAVGAASIGLIPVIMSLLRIRQTAQSTGTDAPTNPT